jgi:uncharacterized repeat protein (TIGR03803 family)
MFRLNYAGKMIAVHNFRYANGVYPNGELTFDSTGAVYVAMNGGGQYGFGTITRFEKSGTATVLHNFAGPPGDGSNPRAGVIRDAAGNLFGTTFFGGTVGLNCPYSGGYGGCGIVFKLDATGQETVLHRFSGGSDGANPNSPLLRDVAGRLFGTTILGGAYGAGAVFALNPTGVFDVLYSFHGTADGYSPNGNLIRDSAGTFYGTTDVGGVFGYGTVFKLDTTRHETVPYSFHGDQDGGVPEAGLVRDAAGNLYGTTFEGGSAPVPYGHGTVFKLDSAGHLTVLHTFTGIDGRFPEGRLLCHKTNLYGTTYEGGHYGLGVVFELAGACGPMIADASAGDPEGTQ